MLRKILPAFLVSLCFALFACTPASPPDRSGLRAATAVPTLDMNNAATLCSAVDQYWARDWSLTIRALEGLEALGAGCDENFDLDSRLYLAYLGYGTALEQRGRNDEAAAAYQVALTYNPLGGEAAARLQRLNVFTPVPPPRCVQNQVDTALAALPEYPPGTGTYVQLSDAQLTLGGALFTIYGVNYYPRDFPFDRFLTLDMDIDALAAEMELLRSAGINTLRIFLRYDRLFTCIGNGAVPLPENFARLDALIQTAARQNMKLILVLNHMPDLVVYPLYSNPSHVDQQTVFIVRRYAFEPAVLAWDLRSGGDNDYTNGSFAPEAVLNWLMQTALVVRQAAPHQLITAGWDDDSAATIPAVDFVSFQNFGDLDALRAEIAALRSQTDLPIFLAATGYPTLEGADAEQLQYLERVFEAAQRNNLAGWAVWMAFDYPLTATCVEPNCPGEITAINRFGLWNTSYFPKLAVDAVLQATGAAR